MDQFHDLFGAKNVNKTRIPAAPPEIDDESDEEGLQVEKLQYKVIILGDGAVGKTSITHRFTSDEFQQSYLSTIGVDWFIKTVTLTESIEVTLQIWDIGGQQIGSKLLGNYIFGSDAVIFVYDMTSSESFNDLDQWMKMVEKATNQKQPIFALIANKNDIAHLRMIPRSQHAAWATKNKCSNLSFEVSAKSGDGVNRAFLHISAALAQINLEIEPEEDNTNILETIADQQQPKVLQAVVEHSKYEDKENENENLGQSKKLVGDATKKKKEKKSRKKKKNEGKDESKIVKSNVCVVQ